MNESRLNQNFAEFKKAMDDMVGVGGPSSYATSATYLKKINYSSDTYETVLETIRSANSDQIIALSEKYIATSGIYQRILTYFSTHLTNDVFIQPKKITSKTINNKKYMENYKKACFFADTVMNPKLNFPRLTYKMLVSGAYYGILTEKSESEVVFKDLPSSYCRSRYKTHKNINVLEFNMQYFDDIVDEQMREVAITEFPKEFGKGYKEYKAKGNDYKWMAVPPQIGIAFYYNDQYRPYFVSMIPSIANLNDYRALEKSLDKQELDRILVQQIPIDTEGNFILTIDEAAELHRGVVNMLRNNAGTDVITTFAEVDMLSLGDKSKVDRDNLEKVERSVYNESGVSRLLFSSDSATSVDMSIKNDMALVLDMEEQYANWLSYQVNLRYSENSKYYFEVTLLPVSHYNKEKMLDLYLKSAQFGFSKIVVGVVSGIKQSSLLDIIEMENELMNLDEIMIPLQSTHTQTGEEETAKKAGGRPKVENEDKADTTVASQESR